MKKIFSHSILLFAILTFVTLEANAQYHITSVAFLNTSGICDSPYFLVSTDCPSGGYIKIYYENGYLAGGVGTSGDALIFANFKSPGNYTIKFVLTDGVLDMDSVVKKEYYFNCKFMPIRIFADIVGTGVYDSLVDPFISFPVLVQVGINGVIADTISCTSGFYNYDPAIVGDVFSYKIISALPAGMSVVYPPSGVVYDTVTASDSFQTNYFGIRCVSTASFDLGVNAVVPVTGVHDQWGNIYVSNTSCYPVDATVTMNFSPKYAFDGEANPAAGSTSSNTITWNLTGVSTDPIDLYYVLRDDAGDLVAGDTVQEHITVTPTTGDSDPLNNIEIIIDSVKAGVDPNEMSVSPSGYISAGTNLQYTVNFENTGDDTAYNISVYDTLSNNVNPQSLKIIMASAVMNIAMLSQGGLNIVKFDFPNINLLDSANHGFCNGAVIFTVSTYTGLPDGTTIYNHAGIFFDYNPVVMTDTVEDIIGSPSGVAIINNPSKIVLYPNPANNKLFITVSDNINSLVISDPLGQTVYRNQYNSPQIEVDISFLPAGVYFVKVNGSEVRKFVKE